MGKGVTLFSFVYKSTAFWFPANTETEEFQNASWTTQVEICRGLWTWTYPGTYVEAKRPP